MGGKTGRGGKVLLNRHFYKWLHVLKRWRRWVLTMTVCSWETFENSLWTLSNYNSLVTGGASALGGLPHPPLRPCPGSSSHVPTISFSWQTMYMSGIPFKTPWGWYHSHCFHILSQGPCTCNGRRTEQGPLLLIAPYTFYLPQDRAVLWLLRGSPLLCCHRCFHILRREIGHSVGRPRSTDHALWVVVVNGASLTWPGVGRLHHHTSPQGSVSVQLSPKKASWQFPHVPLFWVKDPWVKGP